MSKFKALLITGILLLNFNAIAQIETIHFFPLDTDPGWTTEGLWEFGIPQGQGSGNGDPISGHTGDNVYGYNLAGDYTNGMPIYHLQTLPLDCTGFQNVTLKFWRWLGIESATYDHASIQVSNDGENWTVIWEHNGDTFSEASWTEVSYDISEVADHQPTVFIRWTIGTTDSSDIFPGWNIDDISLEGNAADNLALAPASGLDAIGFEGGPFQPDSLIYTLINKGDQPLQWGATAPAWLTANPSGGILLPGTAAILNLTYSAESFTFPPGLYEGTITIANTSSEILRHRPVRLEILPVPGEIGIIDSIPPTTDSTMNFGNQIVGLSTTETLTIYNPDPTHELVITDIGFSAIDENFNDNLAQDWQPDVDSDWEVVDQQYRASSSSIYNTVSMVSTYAGREFTDFSYQVKVRRDIDLSRPAIVLYRATDDFEDSPYDTGSGYAFGIRYNQYLIFKIVKGHFSTIKDWTNSEHINPDDEWNTLKVIVQGSEHQFYINGSMVFSLSDDSISSGRIGLLGYSSRYAQSTYYFDDIRANEILQTESSRSANMPGLFDSNQIKTLNTQQASSTTLGAYTLTNIPTTFPLVIAPGGSYSIDVNYAPQNFEDHAMTVMIDSNDVDEPQIAVLLTGTGIHDDLAITPEQPFEAFNKDAGPFDPPSKTYTLINNGISPLNWEASASASWLTLSLNGGILSPLQSIDILVSINPEAETFPKGFYNKAILFRNINSGLIQNREMKLNVGTKRILAYVQYSDLNEEVENIFSAIDSVSTNYIRTDLDDYTQLAEALPGNDILLIPDPDQAYSSTQRDIGQAWREILNEFILNGGVVILCTHYTDYQIFTEAELMEITDYSTFSSQPVEIVNPADPIAQDLINYTAESNSTWYRTTESNIVVRHAGTGNPVVINKKIGRGNAVLIGHEYTYSNVDQDRVVGNAVFNLPRKMNIAPEVGVGSFGYEGGPFFPSNKSYLLSNNSLQPLSWIVETDVDWLDISTVAGEISVGGAASLNIAINDHANTLKTGIHTGTINFVDSKSEIIQVREVTLMVEFNSSGASNEWYFASGDTRLDLQTYILVNNPNISPATLLLKLLFEDREPQIFTATAEPLSRYTFPIQELLPSVGIQPTGFACQLTSDRPVFAERAMYVSGDGLRDGAAIHTFRVCASAQVGVPQPLTEWFLAEGTTTQSADGQNRDTYIFLANPNAVDVQAELQFYREGQLSTTVQKTIPANRRITFDAKLTAELANANFSASIRSLTGPGIIVDRTMVGSAHEIARQWCHSSAAASATSTQWYFGDGTLADGFETFLTLANPTENPASVMLRFLRETEEPFETTIGVNALQRRTVILSSYPELVGRKFSIEIIVVPGGPGIIAERPIFWRARGYSHRSGASDTIGATHTDTSWFMPEGAVLGRSNFQCEIAIGNPSATDADIEIFFSQANGEVIRTELQLPAGTPHHRPRQRPPQPPHQRHRILLHHHQLNQRRSHHRRPLHVRHHYQATWRHPQLRRPRQPSPDPRPPNSLKTNNNPPPTSNKTITNKQKGRP